jgi:hypothetical protein
VDAQLVASRVVLSSTELVSSCTGMLLVCGSFKDNILCEFLTCSLRATYHVYLVLLELYTQLIIRKHYKL